ncbi:unnamed protein product [Porites lobata]|uniref:Fibrinogen C-terminal domain-containing protein n=1 Tax=Porites lobata TaxID=104759 RepID=A0ABN8NI96_9CNID|nr:unnamed protein product [Porites lobata]
MFVIPVLVFIIPSVASCEEPRCNKTSSVPNSRLLGLAFLVQDAQNLGECIDICNKQTQCRSVNFDWVNFLCELNKADVHIAPQNLMTAKGYVYLDTPWPKFHLRSCAQIRQLVPNAKSGYYWIYVKRKRAQVYCDMDNYGGGWTLVVSISSSSRDHLLNREVNCYSPTRCVEFSSSQIPGRKLSDESIHAISTYEGKAI